MSLTDDTNCQTFDIPLPDEPNHRSSSHPEVANSWTPSATDVSKKTMNANTSAVKTNPYMNPSLPQPYHPYYPYYSSPYQQIPQMMSQSYPYFMPTLMRPMVPTLPTLPVVPQFVPQMSSIVSNSNHMNNNTRGADEDNYEDEDDEDSDPTVARHPSTKANNVLPIHCNDKMGLNPLIFQNIQQSPYFKNNLFQLKTYHEVIDEIFYSVRHLEPWEKGSRKVGGQTGMCGSVRGVGAGGIISTPFCILYKLFTLKLTRKQVNGLIRHKDSPYIRALGFMYIRFTQPPQHLFNWFEPFLDDEEEVDPKAGGGQPMTVGQMCRHMLSKLDWFSALFPRVPVPIQKELESKLRNRDEEYEQQMREERGIEDGEVEEEEEEQEEVVEQDVRRGGGARDKHERRVSVERESRHSKERKRSRSRDKDRSSRSSSDKHRYRRSRSPQHSQRYNRNSDYRTDKSERCEYKRKHR